MTLFIKLYLFIPLSVTLITFQGHGSLKQIQLEIFNSHPSKLKVVKATKAWKPLAHAGMAIYFDQLLVASLTGLGRTNC